MKEKIKDALSIVVFISSIVIVYFKDSIINFIEKSYKDTLLDKGINILYIIIVFCSFCIVAFIIGFGIYSYLKKYSGKGN